MTRIALLAPFLLLCASVAGGMLTAPDAPEIAGTGIIGLDEPVFLGRIEVTATPL